MYREREPAIPCCYWWRKAHQSGTDSECYGALIRSDGESATFGGELADIEFCPWCGKPKTEEPK